MKYRLLIYISLVCSLISVCIGIVCLGIILETL